MNGLGGAAADRARGVLVGMAAGDALGAGYEFGPPLAKHVKIAMIGGGPFNWAPGQWTDDTSMAIAIAEVAASGQELRSQAAQDAIVARWIRWSREEPDIGVQTRKVLDALQPATGTAGTGGLAAAASRAARALHHQTGRTAGNGSLMRTAPVALAYLNDLAALAKAAMELSALTHYDRAAGEACVLWSLAIQHAVLTGDLDARVGLDGLDADRRDRWEARLAEAERARPEDFPKNGWVVHALQGAWSAIATTRNPVGDSEDESGHLRRALEAAVRGGRDTDTVAAIAGGLVGAAYGASAVPAQWKRDVHGWPDMRADGLIALADAIVRGDTPTAGGRLPTSTTALDETRARGR